MLKLLVVGSGGFIGSILRYLSVVTIQGALNRPWWPYGTFAVNVIGCLVIGLLGGLSDNKGLFNPELRLFLMVGILGGFTTFSSFGYETLGMLRDGQFVGAAANVLLSVTLGLIAAFAGYRLSTVF